ncbi:MAG TPA: aspartate ammonia-lyase, partial [Fervidobacterium sp.]|nr:aspartate ammonia-lyase [Fervidobacterium sp.]
NSTSNLTPLINYFGYEKVSQAIKDASWDIQKAIALLAQSEGTSVQELLAKLDINKMTGLGFI